MVVGFLCHGIGKRRNPARVQRREPSGKSRDGEVETAPEEMNRARLAKVRSAELLEDAVYGNRRSEEACHGISIVRSLATVVDERNGVRDLVRAAMEGPAFLKVFRRGPRRDGRCRTVAAHVDKPRKDEAAGAGRHLWGKCGGGGVCCRAHGYRRRSCGFTWMTDGRAFALAPGLLRQGLRSDRGDGQAGGGPDTGVEPEGCWPRRRAYRHAALSLGGARDCGC